MITPGQHLVNLESDLKDELSQADSSLSTAHQQIRQMLILSAGTTKHTDVLRLEERMEAVELLFATVQGFANTRF